MSNVVAGAILVAVVFCCSPASQAQEPKTRFSIPAQPASRGLDAYARQAGVQLLYPYDQVADIKTNAVDGEFSKTEALERLLTGTGLTVESIKEGTIVVRRTSAKTSSKGDTPTQAQPSSSNNTSQDPTAGATTTSPVAPEGGIQAPTAAATLQPIEVTGSHIRGVDSLSPMITITSQEMIDQGYSRLDQVFDNLPQNFKGSTSQESNPVSKIGDTSSYNLTFGSGVNLRGLGAGTTLVLLNGRRLAPTSYGYFTDISSIPVSVIDRVEILTDGASAIYGSDAVGGVVNIITKKDFSGVETGFRATRISQGKQPDIGGNVLGGFNWVSGNLIINIDSENDKPLLAQNRSFAASAPGPLSLLQKMDNTSIYAAVRQDVTSQLSISADILSSNRNYWSIANFTYYNPSVVSTAFGSSGQLAVNTEIKYAISPDWTAAAVYQYSQEKDTQGQLNPTMPSLDNFFTQNSNDPSVDARIDGKLFTLPGGPMQMALGVQSRQESMSSVLTSPASPPAFTNNSRSVQSEYGELFIPIVGRKNAVPLAQQITVDLAIRNDHYSDVGGTTNPKAAVRWMPTPDLTLRASYATSFRAPLLEELGFGRYVYVDNVPSPTAPGGMATVLLLDGTSTSLKPETAKSYNAGFTFKPSFAKGLTVDISYFDINYKDRILRLDQNGFFTNAITNAALLGPLVNLHPTLAQVNSTLASVTAARLFNFTGAPYSPANITAIADIGYNNVGISTVHGLDANVRYERELNFGHVAADFTGTVFTTYDEQITPASTAFSTLNQAYQPLRFRAKANIGWKKGAWTAYGRVNFANSYHNDMDPGCAAGQGIAGPGCHVSSWSTFDLGVSYTTPKSTAFSWAGGWRMSFDVANIANRAPPLVNPAAGSVPPYYYDTNNANPLQRYFGISLTKKW